MSEVYLENAPVAARIQQILYKAHNGKLSTLNKSANPNPDFVEMKSIDLINMPLGAMYIIRPTDRVGQVQLFNGWANMPLYLGDIVCNGKDVLSTLEFFIGGRVTIGSQNVVVINNERSVQHYNSNNRISPLDVTRAIFEGVRCLMTHKNREDGMKITGGLGIRG